MILPDEFMKRFDYKRKFAIIAAFVTILSIGMTVFAQSSAAGTVIFNFAQASYTDGGGFVYSTVSPVVSLTVKAVSSLSVTPDETEPSSVIAANQLIIRQFRICNNGNSADIYTLTRAAATSPAAIVALYYDVNGDGAISNTDIPITLNSTKSPTVAPGACVSVLADIDTRNIAANERLYTGITARSNIQDAANGTAEDDGLIIDTVGRGAAFTDPDDASLPPSKLVENKTSYVAAKNQPLKYLITFRNSGEVAARSVVITDNLPEGLQYVPGTLQLNGRTLTDTEDSDEGSVAGKGIIVRLASVLAPNQVARVNFQAMVVGSHPAGSGIVNTAEISASNAPGIKTNPAVALIDPFGTVYAARIGAAGRISGARVAVFSAQTRENLLVFPANQGFNPNFVNENPYFTNSEGLFSFGLMQNQLGSENQPAVYFVSVTAPNFRSRLLQISLSPAGNGLFKMTIRSLDGMALAAADGFDLATGDVEISDITDIAMNIPMFEDSTLEMTKTADRNQAEIGDLITYRLDIHNASIAPIYNSVVTDTLPDSFNYAAGTARIERGSGKMESIEPVINGSAMQFRLGEIAAGERFSISYRTRIGVNAREGDNYNSAIAVGHFPNNEAVQSASVRVSVKIGGGVFSMRQIVIGRVFVDANGNQTFDKGEQPVVGARVYLANGQSAITDSQGMYNLPAVSVGAQVIALDPVTLPDGYLLADGNSRSGKNWTRLLRTPLGGGGLLRQNFVLKASVNNPPASVKKDGAEAEKNSPQDTAVNANFPKTEEAAVENGEKNEKGETEVFKPVAAGDVLIHSLADNSLIMSPAVNLKVSVAENWKAQIQLDSEKFGENNIGETREDRANRITTYSFVGLSLKPGPNQLRVTAISPNGETGKTTAMTIYGRGAAKRIEIGSDRRELQASGRDSTNIIVRAYDQWGNPAQDASIMVQTTGGRLLKLEDGVKNAAAANENKIVLGKDSEASNGISSEQTNEIAQQQNINLIEGIGIVKLISDNHTGVAKISARLGSALAESEIRFTPEMRPTILTSLAEVTVGSAAPEMLNRGVDRNVQTHVQFFYRGNLLRTKNLLTLGYDSEQPLNRIAGRDRLFQLDPLERAYPIFGDSSTRFQETESNSKLYARVDRDRSYAMFGDFEADMETSRLAGYGRKLTGVKIHLENENNDFITVTGARPDTSFARQIIPGGSFGLVQLAYPNLLSGSEVLTLETRDRRNPEIIISREIMVRSLDYNIDSTSGTIFFLRPVSAFDRELNLIQVVATYEYRSSGIESAVYTGRAVKNIKRLGLRVGLSFVEQRQTDSLPFRLGGADISLKLPRQGRLEAEWAMSRGVLNNGFSFSGSNQSGGARRDGNAFFLSIIQPLPVMQSVLRFEGSTATENFFNPFGVTVTPGATRGAISLEGKPLNKSSVRLNLVGERNSTENVDNNRVTAGVAWSQIINEKVRLSFGYDFRRFSDAKSDRTVLSNLLSFGAEFKPTEKLEIGIKREQNLGEADPSYPNQTTFTASYQLRDYAKIFFTQRLASAAIVPISDVSDTGFAATSARQETAVGVESKFGKYTSMSGRYQLENGANGTDSFAIIGLQNRLPISKTLSVEFGFERAFHLAGTGASYNNFTVGANWLPGDGFRTSARYEVRSRNGFGQIFSFGAAGVLKPGWTTMARFQYGNISFNGRTNRVTDGQAAIAIRPHDTDRYGLLFSYTRRDSYFSNGADNLPTRLRSDVLSADGFYQATKRLELYGRTALKLNGDGSTSLSYADNLTTLFQGRAQYRLSRWIDIAAEGRYLYQPSSGSQRRWFGAETGIWVTPDLRIGGGYNFSKAREIYGFNNNSIYNHNGFYFVISLKLSRLFNLFGTSEKGLKEDPILPAAGDPIARQKE